jgi:hypothetical protein
MLCVGILDYSIIVNGNIVDPNIPGRVLQQEDPLRPYLFFMMKVYQPKLERRNSWSQNMY